MALGRIFALQYFLWLQTFWMSYHPPFQSVCPAAAWQGLWELPFALQQPPLCSHWGGVSLLFSSLPCPILPRVSDVTQTSQFSPMPFGLSGCHLLTQCQETSRAKVREGAVADWSIHACRCVICTTADVVQVANKVLAILYLTILLGDLKTIPTQINRFLPIDVSSFPYSVRTEDIQQWWKLQSAQEHQLEYEKTISVGLSGSVALCQSTLLKVPTAFMVTLLVLKHQEELNAYG